MEFEAAVQRRLSNPHLRRSNSGRVLTLSSDELPLADPPSTDSMIGTFTRAHNEERKLINSSLKGIDKKLDSIVVTLGEQRKELDRIVLTLLEQQREQQRLCMNTIVVEVDDEDEQDCCYKLFSIKRV